MSKELLGDLELNRVHHVDCLEGLRKINSSSIQTCVTSPPYWGLRDYNNTQQIGLETNVDEYIDRLVKVFSEVKRVLKEDGTLWLNLGDTYMTKSYKHLKPKDMLGLPWKVAFALQENGWWLRSDIVWNKPNAMPTSIKDRPTKSHEYIFLLSKSKKYYYDTDSIREPYTTEMKGKPHNKKYGRLTSDEIDNLTANGTSGSGFSRHEKGRNKRTVWTVPTSSQKDAHFAVFPEELIKPCILAGCPEEGTVLDPFMGSGTTAVVAKKLNRNFIGFELNGDYIKIAENRFILEV